MLKRNLAVILLAGLVIGGGAVAWARGGPSRPTLAADTAATPSPDGSAGDGSSGDSTRRAAVQKCLADAGIQRGSGQRPTADQRAKVKQCLQAAGLVNGRRGGRGGYGFFRRAVHGDLIVRDGKGGFENVAFDRGTAAGVSGDQLTISRADGKSVTVTITSDTRFKGVKSASDLRQGQPVLAVSKDGKALLVAQRSARAGAGGDTGNGTGRPTAVPADDNLS